MRRIILFLTVLCPLLASAKLPNIVFIISDDQTWTDYGFMGHKQIETPNIDRLAAQSLTFTHGYVPSSLCCPSLATMITGLYPHQSKITGNEPPIPKQGKRTSEYARRFQEQVALIDKVPTLPRMLKEKGYVSHQSGKWWQGNYKRGGFTHGMTTRSQARRSSRRRRPAHRPRRAQAHLQFHRGCRRQAVLYLVRPLPPSHAAHTAAAVARQIQKENRVAFHRQVLGHVRVV